MLSSPPVNSSLHFPAQPAPPAQGRTGYIIGAVAVALIGLAWLATSKQPSPAPASTGELATLPPPPERPAPAAAAPSAAPANAASATAETPPPPRAKVRPKPPGPGAIKATSGTADDSTLFSGRK